MCGSHYTLVSSGISSFLRECTVIVIPSVNLLSLVLLFEDAEGSILTIVI